MGGSRRPTANNRDKEKPSSAVIQLGTKTSRSGGQFLVDLLQKYDSGEVTDFIFVAFHKDRTEETAFTVNAMQGKLELSGKLLSMAVTLSQNDFGR